MFFFPAQLAVDFAEPSLGPQLFPKDIQSNATIYNTVHPWHSKNITFCVKVPHLLSLASGCLMDF